MSAVERLLASLDILVDGAVPALEHVPSDALWR